MLRIAPLVNVLKEDVGPAGSMLAKLLSETTDAPFEPSSVVLHRSRVKVSQVKMEH
jgi:hypothetical protein